MQHENASVQMFDHLVKVNDLEKVMMQYGLSLPDDLVFIKEQIAGPLDPKTPKNKVQLGSASGPGAQCIQLLQMCHVPRLFAFLCSVAL